MGVREPQAPPPGPKPTPPPPPPPVKSPGDAKTGQEMHSGEATRLALRLRDYLNELNEIDPDAVRRLCFQRVPCNDRLRDHPTVQVRSDKDGSNAAVGLLGILNGLLRGRALIVAELQEFDGPIDVFRAAVPDGIVG